MGLNVKIKQDPRIEINARRTLDGNIMIFDHEDIDIILMIGEEKCLTFPKEDMSDRVYSSQDRMFKFLVRKGIIDPSSVRGGNIYGSMEASILQSSIPGIDNIQATLYSLSEYITQEKPYFKAFAKHNLDKLDQLLRPSDEDSTDLGDVPQQDAKGSLDTRVRPYGFRYNYSLLREEEGDD